MTSHAPIERQQHHLHPASYSQLSVSYNLDHSLTCAHVNLAHYTAGPSWLGVIFSKATHKCINNDIRTITHNVLLQLNIHSYVLAGTFALLVIPHCGKGQQQACITTWRGGGEGRAGGGMTENTHSSSSAQLCPHIMQMCDE